MLTRCHLSSSCAATWRDHLRVHWRCVWFEGHRVGHELRMLSTSGPFFRAFVTSFWLFSFCHLVIVLSESVACPARFPGTSRSHWTSRSIRRWLRCGLRWSRSNGHHRLHWFLCRT